MLRPTPLAVLASAVRPSSLRSLQIGRLARSNSTGFPAEPPAKLRSGGLPHVRDTFASAGRLAWTAQDVPAAAARGLPTRARKPGRDRSRERYARESAMDWGHYRRPHPGSKFPGGEALYIELLNPSRGREWTFARLASEEATTAIALDLLFEPRGSFEYLPLRRAPSPKVIFNLLRRPEVFSKEQALAMARLVLYDCPHLFVHLRVARLLASLPLDKDGNVDVVVATAFRAIDDNIQRIAAQPAEPSDLDDLITPTYAEGFGRVVKSLEHPDAFLHLSKDAVKPLRKALAKLSPYEFSLRRSDLPPGDDVDALWKRITVNLRGFKETWLGIASQPKLAEEALELLFLDGPCKYQPGGARPPPQAMAKMLRELSKRGPAHATDVRIVDVVLAANADPLSLVQLVGYLNRPDGGPAVDAARKQVELRLATSRGAWRTLSQTSLGEVRGMRCLEIVDGVRPGFGQNGWELPLKTAMSWNRFFAEAHVDQHRDRLLILHKRLQQPPPLTRQQQLSFADLSALHAPADPVCGVLLLHLYVTLGDAERRDALLATMRDARAGWDSIRPKRPVAEVWAVAWELARGELRPVLGDDLAGYFEGLPFELNAESGQVQFISGTRWKQRAVPASSVLPAVQLPEAPSAKRSPEVPPAVGSPDVPPAAGSP